jgi:Flp pilus assembly protein TadD
VNTKTLFTAVFALLLSAGVFWSLSAGLSHHLGKPDPHASKAKKQSSAEALPLSAELKELEAEVNNNPKDIELRLRFADAMISEARKTGEVAHLMRAVQSYSKALEIEPRNKGALLGMANVSFESGVFDKAKDYFNRLLEVDPGNLKARTDLNLVKLQLGETEEALQGLQRLARENAKSFPITLSLALAQKMVGDRESARATANSALPLAPDEDGRKIVQNFLSGLDQPDQEKRALAADVSPAIAIDQFFRSHPIVGPKVKRISWSDATSVQVRLAEFPMDKMPPFAREKFIRSVKGLIQSFSSNVKVQLIADEDGKVMEEISAG